jgi:hypothetical protein
MTKLHAYFDDSADPKHERYMAVGGLVGTGVQFDELDIFWCSATNGLTEPFRSTECECQQGQFSTWNKSDCDSLMKQLVEIIRQTQLHGVGFIVPVADYRHVFPDAQEYDPYFLAVRHTLINMAYVASPKPSLDRAGKIDLRIVCEESTTTSARAKKIYDELKTFPGWRWGKAIAGFSTGTKRLMPLQAADLIAREAYKHAVNLGMRPTRKPVKTLHNRLSFHLWTRPALEYLRDHGGPADLTTLTGWGQSAEKPPQMHRFYGTTFDLG